MTKEVKRKARSFLQEFRAFAVKGNALELAIAVIIGNAFTGIVQALVNDIITPLISLVGGGNTTDMKNLSLVLRAPLGLNPGGQPLLLKYGDFLATIINFLLLAFAIFLFYKLITSTRKRLFSEEEKVPQYEKPAQERLLEEIRDLLRRRLGDPTEPAIHVSEE